MNILKNRFSLTHKITLIVPNTKNVNETFDNSRYVQEALTMFSKLFGGATAIDTTGAWYSDSLNQLVIEHPTQVYSNCTEDQLNKYIDEIVAYAEVLKIELSQDAIGLEVDGSLYFI